MQEKEVWYDCSFEQVFVLTMANAGVFRILMRVLPTHGQQVLFAALLLLVIGAPAVFCQQNTSAAPEVLTLDQALNIALRDNRTVKNAQLAVEKSDEQLGAARTARLPSFKLYTVVSEDLVKHNVNLTNPFAGIFPGVGPFFTVGIERKPTAVFAAQVLQPISQQYKIGLGLNLLKLERQVDQEKLRAEQQALVDQVKRAYYGILLTESGLESVREEVKSYRELDRVTGEFVIQQVALKADHLQVQTQLAKAEYESVDLSNKLSTQKEQFNSLLGRDVFTEFGVLQVTESSVLESDVTAARRRAIEQRPELKEARLRLQQANLDKRIKHSEYIPDVSAGFTSLALRNFDQVVPRNIASVGVVVSWEPFDWGRKKRQLAEKQATVEQAKNGLRETEDQILIDVSDKFRKLQQTGMGLRVAKLGRETARERLRVMTSSYKFQAVLFSDVLQSQASLSESNHQYQQALLSFWTAKAEFEKALGEDK
jgi:outer membrane protein TolC